MREEVEEALEDARRHLRISKHIFEHDEAADATASRAYYEMFYAAEALLLSRGEAFSKHQDVIGAFGKDFARTRELPPELHGFLKEAFRLRQVADYKRGRSVAPEDAALALERAEQFVEAVADYIHKHGEQ